MTNSSSFNDYDEYDEIENDVEIVDSAIIHEANNSQLESLDSENLIILDPPNVPLTPDICTKDQVSANVWEFREGGAVNESEEEYQLFCNYLRLGVGRNKSYTASLYKFSYTQVNSISKKNNWNYRSKMYDNECLTLNHEELDKKRVRDHQTKLEKYRQHQEFLANQASHMAMKLLVINMRKIDKILEEEEDLSVIDVSNLGTLAHKMAHLGKELGAQALGVDALLEAIEDSSMQE